MTPGMEDLSVDECLRMLAERVVGRLAVDDGRGPVIFPVNYRVEHGMVLIRTAVGSKFDAADRVAWAAFEVDDVSPSGDAGWSVVVRGRLRPLLASEGGGEDPRPFPAGERPFLIGLMPGQITGRRYRNPHNPVRRLPEGAGEVWRRRDGDATERTSRAGRCRHTDD